MPHNHTVDPITADNVRAYAKPGHGRTIQNVHAREILDSRGFPTIEVELSVASGMRARASVPSGASTGAFEAVERRDGEAHRFAGKGVRHVIEHIHNIIQPKLMGLRVDEQRTIDDVLCTLDGTDNKQNLGANATLPISLACARMASRLYRMPLFKYLGGITQHTLPMPLINILNGGAHANNGLSVQEFMIVPVGAHTFLHALELSHRVFFALKTLLNDQGMSTAVGDEGGFAPSLTSTQDGLDLVMRAIEKAGLKPGDDIALALDVAASELYHETPDAQHKGHYIFDDVSYSNTDLLEKIYTPMVSEYPIISIEDPFDQNDFEGFAMLTKKFGKTVQVVGDDVFVTNPVRLQKGVDTHAANAILIKLNQIGTLTETLDVIDRAHRHQYRTIISHRSGETEDTFIADLAVATGRSGAGTQIKTGSLARSERTAKYNQLLRIHDDLGAHAAFINPFYV